MILTFMDLLGTKSKWSQGGRTAAELVFQQFEKLIAGALSGMQTDEIITGGIESDSCAFVFKSIFTAAEFVKRACTAAFKTGRDGKGTRLWLRGAMLPYFCEGDTKLRLTQAMADPFSQVEKYKYNGELLDAIAIEKSGYKGMRIVTKKALIISEVQKAMDIGMDGITLKPFSGLDYSPYPKAIENDFVDYLWMLDAEKKTWEENMLLMANRLRWSSRDSEEFLHAAATQLVFNECIAIFQSLVTRNKQKKEMGITSR